MTCEMYASCYELQAAEFTEAMAIQAEQAKRARLRCERDARIKEQLELHPEAQSLACTDS